MFGDLTFLEIRAGKKQVRMKMWQGRSCSNLIVSIELRYEILMRLDNI